MAKSKKAAESEAAPQVTPVQRQLLEALTGELARKQTTTNYRLALAAVAAVNLLLPLVYVGLLCLIAHAIWWNYAFHRPTTGKGLLVYFGVYLLGGLTLAFLIKPLFARLPKQGKRLPLKRSAEPFLYEYVETLCDVVGAPHPDRICVDCQPNASAGFSHGFLGLLTGRLTLTIGLPLAAGLTARQMTGVLAHEFGHFSQGAGMRMSFTVMTVNNWLSKITFLRDEWDEYLARASNSDNRLGLLLYVPRFCIWLSRQLLFGILWVGSAISCYMMRQMEFDADRYEYGVVGAKTFAGTFKRLRELSVAHQMALYDLDQFQQEGRLADDLPMLMVSNIPHIKPEFRKAINKAERERQTGLFDSHPTDRERIAQAREEQTAGLFRLKGSEEPPASVLFANYERLCKAVSVDLYKTCQGPYFKKSKLHPVRDLIKRREAEFQAGEALDRYFQVHIPVDRPLSIPAVSAKPPEKPQETLEQLKAAREKMLTLVKEYETLSERYRDATKVLHAANEAVSVLDCGLSIRGSDFLLPDGQRKTADKKLKRARAAVTHLACRMLEFETAAAERISLALRLLQVPKVAARIPEGDDLQVDIKALIPDAVFISGMIDSLPVMYILYRRLHVLWSRLGRRNSNRLIAKVIQQLENMHNRLSTMHTDMDGRWYPFDHKDGALSMQEFCLPVVPEPYDVGGLIFMTERMVERLYALQVRLFGRLTHAAEQVETALGMPPLAERKKKD